MTPKKPKFETIPGDILVSDKAALQNRTDQKAKAPTATIDDFVKFFMSHDGTPPQEFVIMLRTSPPEMSQLITNLKELLDDPSYAEDYFSATGINLNVCPSDRRYWAEKIASAVLGQTPTLQ